MQIRQKIVRVSLNQVAPIHVVYYKQEQRPDGDSPIQLADNGLFLTPGPPEAWVEAVCIFVRRWRCEVGHRSRVVKHRGLRGYLTVPGAFLGAPPEADDGLSGGLGGLQNGPFLCIVIVGAGRGVFFVYLDDLKGLADLDGCEAADVVYIAVAHCLGLVDRERLRAVFQQFYI